MDLRLAHTADLDEATLGEARALLYSVFGDQMVEEDWEHGLGGIHALAYEDGRLVGHASVVQRRLLHAGRALRTGYVEGVGVRADVRGRGYGSALMTELERIIRGAYALGALSATDEGASFYAARGWQLWRGPTSALTPSGIVRTENDDDAIWVLPVDVPLDPTAELTADWREGTPW